MNMNITSAYSAGGMSAPSFSEMKQKMQAGMEKLQKADPELAKSLNAMNKTIEADVKNGTDPSKDIQSFVKGLSSSQKSELESTFGAPPSGGFHGVGQVRNGQVQQLLGGSSNGGSDLQDLLKLLDSSKKSGSSDSKSSTSNSSATTLASLISRSYGAGNSAGIDLNSLFSSGVTA